MPNLGLNLKMTIENSGPPIVETIASGIANKDLVFAITAVLVSASAGINPRLVLLYMNESIRFFKEKIGKGPKDDNNG